MRLRQLVKKKKNLKKWKKKLQLSALQGSPQKKGVCVKVFTMSPRKPNSAVRKVCKVVIQGNKKVLAYIVGEGHSLQEHSTVLLRGGRTQDLPGTKFKVVRGALDCLGVSGRRSSRSKYGVKKLGGITQWLEC